jgi:ribonuclease HI
VIDGSGAEEMTTNNRMELSAAIEGLAALKRRCRVELVTDSEYVGKASATGRRSGRPTAGGAARGRVSSRGQRRPVEAAGRAGRPARAGVQIVLGHNGHPENEACDRMAVAAYKALMADRR